MSLMILFLMIQTSVKLLAEFNIGTARQVCFSAEIRMWLEHEVRGRQRFEGKCSMQANWLKERDAEIANLKDQLSLKEAEAADAICLRGQVAALESAAVSKDAELASSNAQIARATQDLSNLQLSCDDMSVKASSLEFKKDKLVSALETTCSNLYDEVMGYKLFKDQVEAVQDDMDDIMDLLCLDGPAAETLEASQLQPSPEQLMRIIGEVAACRLSLTDVMVPLIEPMSVKSLTGEASTFRIPTMATTTALSTTFIQASTVPPAPSTKVPPSPKIVFEREELDTTLEHTSVS
ncbi:hypothetical protein Tco_0052444 [Tanacetum coccineum]